MDETIYGLDFGFNNPTALLEVGIKDQEYYLTQKLYRTKLTNTELIQQLEQLKINKSAVIYADSAEPARIQEILQAGYNIHQAEKNVKDGIDYCKNCVFYTCVENEDLNKERQSYRWRENKLGQILDEPEKFDDHLMDALRYAVYTYARKAKPGVRIL
jgi:phage terminase large subunit